MSPAVSITPLNGGVLKLGSVGAYNGAVQVAKLAVGGIGDFPGSQESGGPEACGGAIPARTTREGPSNAGNEWAPTVQTCNRCSVAEVPHPLTFTGMLVK